jgi:hypothetical protein
MQEEVTTTMHGGINRWRIASVPEKCGRANFKPLLTGMGDRAPQDVPPGLGDRERASRTPRAGAVPSGWAPGWLGALWISPECCPACAAA